MIISFTELTVAQWVPLYQDLLPRWTYNLTPILSLPAPNETAARFVGVISGVSNIANLKLPHANALACRRHVPIDNGSNDSIKITLWGDAALRFNGKVVRFLGEKELAAAIFVGLTVKMNEGAKELAGASACRWYINEDIEEINILLASTLESPFRPILHLHTPRCMTLRALVPGPYPIKELMELANIDLLQNQGSIFMCIVTIWRLALGQRWWVTCCPRCGHASVPIRSSSANLEGCQCSNNQCTSMEAMPQQHGSGQVCLAWKSCSGYNWPFP